MEAWIDGGRVAEEGGDEHSVAQLKVAVRGQCAVLVAFNMEHTLTNS